MMLRLQNWLIHLLRTVNLILYRKIVELFSMPWKQTASRIVPKIFGRNRLKAPYEQTTQWETENINLPNESQYFSFTLCKNYNNSIMEEFAFSHLHLIVLKLKCFVNAIRFSLSFKSNLQFFCRQKRTQGEREGGRKSSLLSSPLSGFSLW